MQTPDEDFGIVVEKPGEFLFAGYQNVNVVVWYAGATLAGVQLMESAIPARAEAFPEGMSTVHITGESAGLPSPEAREAFVQQAERWARTIACVAIVIEKTGFSGSALRSAITGILMLARGRFPTRVHGAVREAAAWMAPIHTVKTGVSVDARTLQKVFERVRDLRTAVRSDDSTAPLSM